MCLLLKVRLSSLPPFLLCFVGGEEEGGNGGRRECGVGGGEEGEGDCGCDGD